ncbi:uncharacterized protein ABKV19_018605 [Rosa sericea]
MGSLSRRNPTSPLTVFPLLIILSSFAYCEVGKPSAYEVLQQYGFPIGILPIGVTGYELNTETGQFSAYLNGTCSFSVEDSYQLEYKSTITGVLSKDRLKDLKGVSVKLLFFWLSIVEVFMTATSCSSLWGLLQQIFQSATSRSVLSVGVDWTVTS